ncbi:STT3 domain-containing protein [Methanocaldococcus indicus]|uniref:STT3 domain-containing protein n=1 Tax=Methanocaldococcus indicus TaxID=213231 RepID=UPI003C6D774C
MEKYIKTNKGEILIEKINKFFKEKEWLKICLIIIFLMFLSFQLRAQTADMKFAQNNEILKKMFSDEHGRMYLLALDPYYYLRLSENLYYKGYIGETLKVINGKLVPYDSIQYAPPGHPVSWEPPIICLVEDFLYIIWHSFDNTVTIMNAAFWFPALLSVLLGIPIFFIVRRVTNSNIGGLVGAIALITAPNLFSKTVAGFADTPIFEVLPILYIIWFILEGLHFIDSSAFKSKKIDLTKIYLGISFLVVLITGVYLSYIAQTFEIVRAAIFFYIFSILSILAGLIIIAYKYFKNQDIEFEMFIGLAVLTTVLAPKMWGAWWYGFDVVAIFLVVYLILISVLKNVRISYINLPNIKNAFLLAGLYLVGSLALISIIYGANMALSPILSPIGMQKVLSSNTYVLPSGWPNVYQTVAELQKPNSFREIFIDAIGRVDYGVLGILGILSSFIILRREKISLDIKYSILLTIWLTITLYASTKGIRFTSLATPPLAIGLGIIAGQIDRILRKYESSIYGIGIPIVLFGLFILAKYSNKLPNLLVPSMYVPIAEFILLVSLALLFVYKIVDIYTTLKDKKETIIKVSSVLLAIGLVVPMVAAVVPFTTAPTFNNGWKESLEWIKENTPNNSVITCWWDNGHIYTWATRKMVTFDGGCQNTPRAYWVGRIFATSNESLAVGIIRMIATSGDKAYQKDGILWNYTHGNVSMIVKILNEILPVDRTKAYDILVNKYHLKPEDAKTLLNYTHPEHPNPDYLITYNRMTDIAPVWSMFGFWNFSLPPNTPNEKREKGAFYKGISKEYSNNLVVANIRLGNLLYSVVINGSNVSTYILREYYGQYQPVGKFKLHKVYIMYPNGTVVERIVDKDGELSLFVRLKENGYGWSWLATRNLEDSIYARLHFLDGYGLKHIRLVKESFDPTNPGIQPGFKVYEVDYGKEYLQ